MDGLLEKGVLVRYRVTTLKYLHNDFVSSTLTAPAFFLHILLVGGGHNRRRLPRHYESIDLLIIINFALLLKICFIITCLLSLN